MGLTPKEKKVYRILQDGIPCSIDEIVQTLNSQSKTKTSYDSVLNTIETLRQKATNIGEVPILDSDDKKYYVPFAENLSTKEKGRLRGKIFNSEQPKMTAAEEKVVDILENGYTYTLDDLSKRLKLTESSIKGRIQSLRKKGANIEEAVESGITSYSVPTLTLPELILQAGGYEPIKTSLLEPLVIKVKDQNHPKVGFNNTMNLGGADNPYMIKNFLRFSKYDNVDAIVLTGNLLKINLKKSSMFIDEFARLSSVESDFKRVKYPAKVVSEGKAPAKMEREGKPRFMTLRENLENLVENNLRDVFVDANDDPIYNGPVYIFFGDTEEKLVRRLTNDALKRSLEIEREDIAKKIKDLKSNLGKKKKETKEMVSAMFKDMEINPTHLHPDEKQEYINEHLGTDEDDSRYARTIKNIESLEQTIKDMEKFKKRRLSRENLNNDPGYVKKVNAAMTSVVIDMLESAIPNSKVIGTGDGYIKLGDKVIQIMHDARKNCEAPSDTIMNYVLLDAQNRTSAGEDFPNAVVCGGLSTTHTMLPYANIDENGSNTVNLFTLPTCLNSNKLEEIARNQVRTKDSDTKLASKMDFTTAAVTIEYVGGIIKEKILLEAFLTNETVFGDPSDISFSPLLYGASYSDLHIGSKYASLMKDGKVIRYLFDVMQEFLLANDLPLVRINDLGDQIQAKNYETETERHPDFLEPFQLEQRKAMLKQTIKSKTKLIEELENLVTVNTIRSGLIAPQQQEYEFMNLINYRLLNSIIARNRKLGLYGPAICLTGGNHEEHTFHGLHIPVLDFQREMMIKTGASDREIKTNVLGKNTIIEGLYGLTKNPEMSEKEAMESNDGYLYAEYHRHSQGTSKNKDSMKTMRDAYTKRGRTFFATKGRTTINYKGHDHKGGFSVSKNAIHVGVPCAQDRNEFGEQRDFPGAIQGFHILGVPAHGPAYGPIVSSFVYKENLEEWVSKKKEKIDKKGLCDYSITYDDD